MNHQYQFDAARVGDLHLLRVALTVGNVNDVSGGGWTALHWAAENGHEECVTYCLEMGANVNARTQYGITPLLYASWKGHVNAVRVLLDAGALVDSTDKYGYTPRYYAILYKYVDVSRYLIDRGAKVSNVKLNDFFLSAIPDWVTTFIESRSNCRTVSITIIGIHKYRRTTVTCNNDINVLRLIAKHIWSSRMDDLWVTPIEVETKKLRRNPKRGGM
jgi:hypothetical protein